MATADQMNSTGQILGPGSARVKDRIDLCCSYLFTSESIKDALSDFPAVERRLCVVLFPSCHMESIEIHGSDKKVQLCGSWALQECVEGQVMSPVLSL